jgi:hypothetical protein
VRRRTATRRTAEDGGFVDKKSVASISYDDAGNRTDCRRVHVCGGAIPTTPGDSDSVAFLIVGAAAADGNTRNHRQNSRFNLRCCIYIQQRLTGTEHAAVASIPQI